MALTQNASRKLWFVVLATGLLQTMVLNGHYCCCVKAKLLLLLLYHRCLRMIVEALELRVKGRRDSHSWCMCVVGHGYGRLGVGARMEVVDGMK